MSKKSAENTAENVYDRIARLEDEIASLRTELERIKGALRNKIARHEISMVKHGEDIRSIID